MAHDRNKTAPNWAKDAVASPQGWRDAKTGELLVSYKGLDKVVGSAPKAEKKATKKAPKVEVEVEETAEEAGEE